MYVKTRNQLVKKEVADAEPLELHLDPLQGDEKDEARGVVELRGGKGAGLRATQRQNDLDSRLVNISKLNKSYMVSQKWNFEGRVSRIS